MSAGQADLWDEVWDQHEAMRSRDAMPRVLAPPVAAAPAANPLRSRWRMLLLGAVAVACVAVPVADALQPPLRLAEALWRQDAAGLLAQIVVQPDGPALRRDLRRQAGLPGVPASDLSTRTGAQQFLSVLADQIADGWADPGAVGQVVRARLDQVSMVRDPALARLERLHALWPRGWGGLRLDIGPRDGGGGFGLELAWSDGAWRATGVALLDPPSNFHAGG